MKANVLAILTISTLSLFTLPARAGDAAYPEARDILSTGRSVVDEPIQYPADGPAHVTASIVTIPPGTETAWHQHGVPLFAYILSGTLSVDYGAKGRRSYHPGDAFMEAMAVTHRGVNAGGEPVRILAVYMGAEGAANVVIPPH